MNTKEPMAYAVFCPIGDKFDYRVYTELLEAQDQADHYSSISSEDEEEFEVIPLYPKE